MNIGKKYYEYWKMMWKYPQHSGKIMWRYPQQSEKGSIRYEKNRD